MANFTKDDFRIEKRAGGWAVTRSDGAIIALGFRTRRDANEWWTGQSAAVETP